MAGRAPEGFFKRNRKWHVRTDPVTRLARSTKCTDLDAAKRWYREQQRKATDPNYQAQDEGLEVWAMKLIEQKKLHKSAGTVHFYTKKLGHLVRLFGAETSLTSLRPSRWDEYVVQRKREGAANSTIDKEIKVGKVLCKYAAREGAFRGDVSLFKPSDFSAERVARDRFLTPEELVKLLAELRPKRRAWVSANVAFGARFSEVLRARSEDVDTEHWTVRVRGSKTRRSAAVVPIAEPFRVLALAALPFLPLEPWANMRRDLAQACERAGIPKVTSNDLRRTHGSWLKEAGVALDLIASVLRHSSVKTTHEVYARARPEKLGEAISAQLSVTKSLQAPGDDDPKGPIVQVAQSVEQWTENPDVSFSGTAADTPTCENHSDHGVPHSAHSDADSRSVRNVIVTAARNLESFRLRAGLAVAAAHCGVLP